MRYECQDHELQKNCCECRNDSSSSQPHLTNISLSFIIRRQIGLVQGNDSCSIHHISLLPLQCQSVNICSCSFGKGLLQEYELAKEEVQGPVVGVVVFIASPLKMTKGEVSMKGMLTLSVRGVEVTPSIKGGGGC